jgi:hypothetical protein
MLIIMTGEILKTQIINPNPNNKSVNFQTLKSQTLRIQKSTYKIEIRIVLPHIQVANSTKLVTI